MNNLRIIILLLLSAVLGIALPAWSQENNKRVELEKQLEELQIATEKFKDFGVGVSLFEAEIAAIRRLLAGQELESAEQKIQRLKASLSDQQRRFYASKLLVYNQQKEKLSAERKAKRKTSGRAVSDAAGFGRAAHEVLKEDKGRKYTPLIYPIAR